VQTLALAQLLYLPELNSIAAMVLCFAFGMGNAAHMLAFSTAADVVTPEMRAPASADSFSCANADERSSPNGMLRYCGSCDLPTDTATLHQIRLIRTERAPGQSAQPLRWRVPTGTGPVLNARTRRRESNRRLTAHRRESASRSASRAPRAFPCNESSPDALFSGEDKRQPAPIKAAVRHVGHVKRQTFSQHNPVPTM
jgi:hypothetical protein